MDNYGLGMNRKYEKSPMRKPVPPVAPQLPSGASLAARGQQMNPYQPVNPQSRMNTYGNVQLPPTELGPNQSTAGVRDRIAGAYDPQSWNNATNTPGEIRTQVANRTEQTLAGIRNAPDRTGARSQYQYSPLAPASAFQGLNDATAANREQQMARIRTVRASQDQSLANDPQAARRLAAMTGQANAVVNPNDYRGRMARATNQYNMYAASTRADGKTPMPFDDFLSQLAPNAMTPEVRNAITQTRWNREANRPSAPQGQPNMQASQFLASRYGVPMQIPQDPQQAAQWTQTLAMQGNPYAASLNQQAIQQGYATQQQAIDQAGQNYRAQLNNQPKPPAPAAPPTIDQTIQFFGLLNEIQNRPSKIRQDILEEGRQSPDWNDPAKRAAIVNRANQAEAEEKARVQQQIDSMRGSGPLAGMFPGLSSPATPAAPAVMPSAPTGTSTTAPPPSETQPAPIPAGSKDADAILTNLPPRQASSTGRPADALVIYNAWQDARAALDGRDPTPDEVKKVLAERGYSIQSDEELFMSEGAITGGFPAFNSPQVKKDYQDFRDYMNQNTEQFGLPLPRQRPLTREEQEQEQNLADQVNRTRRGW